EGEKRASCPPFVLMRITKNMPITDGVRMLLKTILNGVERHASFVYGQPKFEDATESIVIPISPRANTVNLFAQDVATRGFSYQI
ncbi:MAG: hypothetical protein ACI97A_000988, partial [Planctomycetota bacterium]